MTSTRKSTITIIAGAALILGGLYVRPLPARAQEQAKGDLRVIPKARSEAAKQNLVLITVSANGRVFRQTEHRADGDWEYFPGVPIGPVEIRVEGEGFQTQVKRGIHITNERTFITFDLSPGTGTKVTEYAPAAISREEIQGLLARLETAVRELSKR